MGFEQDSIFPMIRPSPELVRFGGFKYSDSLLDLVSIQPGFQIVTKSPDCKNVYWRDGALWQMDGSERYVVTPLPAAAAGLFVYGQESTATQYVIAMTSTQVFRNVAGVWTDITGAYSVSGAQHFGLTFNSRFIAVTSDRSAPYKIEGTGNIAALGGTPPSGKVIGRIGEFILIANTALNPNLAYYCDPGNAESGWNKFFDIASVKNDVSGITAIGELDSRSGYIFKERSADRIEHTGGVQFIHDRGYLSIGVVAQATLQKASIFIEGRAVDVLIGLSNDGVYAFDTSKNPYNISKDIAFKFDRNKPNRWNRSHWHKSVGMYDETRHWYWLWVPSASSAGQLDELWICDLETFDWWPANPQNSSAMCMINDTLGNPQVHAAGYDGHTRRFAQTIKNYDGVAIDGYYLSGVIDFKRDIRLRQFIPYAKQVGNYNLDFKLFWGLSAAPTAVASFLLSRGGGAYGSGTYGSATYGDGRPVYKNMAGLNYTGRYLQIFLGNNRLNQGFTLFKIEMPARVFGGRTGATR